MAVDIANENEKQYGEIDFIDPIISFGDNEIQFESKLTFVEELFVFIGFLALLITVFIMQSLWLTIIFGVNQLYYIYELITSRNIAKIDFLKKELYISNPIWLVNDLRKVFNRPVRISFQEISSFKNYKRTSYWMKSRQNVLVAKILDQWAIKIAKFRYERDSGTMAVLLNQYVVGKARIIE